MAEYVCTPYGLTIDGRNEGEYDRRERVIRCRDCKHGMCGGLCTLFAFPLGDGHIIPADVEPDGFCAWGERRGES